MRHQPSKGGQQSREKRDMRSTKSSKALGDAEALAHKSFYAGTWVPDGELRKTQPIHHVDGSVGKRIA